MNYANMYTNILAALDNHGEYTDAYFKTMLASTLSEQFRSPFLDTSKSGALKASDWIRITFRQLETAVLDGSSALLDMDPAIRKGLQQDFEGMEKELGLPNTGAPADRVDAILDTQGKVIDVLSQNMSPMNQSSGAQDVGGMAAGMPKTYKALANFGWIQQQYEAVDKSPVFKGAFGLCIVSLSLSHPFSLCCVKQMKPPSTSFRV